MTAFSPFVASALHGGDLILRLIATTDLHAALMPYDYVGDRPAEDRGLALAARLIAAARAEVGGNALLVDNGDFLQGTELADWVAANAARRRGPHPVIAAFHALGYDAATVGNHEFNFGLPFLDRVLSQARFPVVTANLVRQRGRTPLDDTPWRPPYALLTRSWPDRSGAMRTLRVGVIGFTPPQTLIWDRQNLEGRMEARDIVEAAQAWVPRMRAEGADLVIALSHSGIGPAEATPMMENASTALAAVPGIDAVVAGHSHLVFPGPGAPEGPGIDAVAGRLAGKPAVLPGHTGRHVGLIDLCLRQGREGWRVLAHRTEVRPVQPARAPLPLRADPGAAVRRAASAAHRATLAAMRRPLAHTETELCSHFMMLAACPTLTLVARAQADHVAAALAGTPWADLPLLSAVAPFKAGGRGGPRHYIDIPAGPLERRHAAELYGFPNEIRAVAVTGAGLRGWLERSAEWYRQIAPGAQDAPLLDPQFPSFNFDQILGLTWEIDLSAPPGARIGAIRHGGRPVAEGDRFVVATNSYRANGSGGFDSACPMEVVLREPRLVRDVVETWLRTQGRVAPQPERPFRFRPMPGTSVLILSSPEALRREATLTLMGIEPIEGADPQGFARFRLRL